MTMPLEPAAPVEGAPAPAPEASTSIVLPAPTDAPRAKTMAEVKAARRGAPTEPTSVQPGQNPGASTEQKPTDAVSAVIDMSPEELAAATAKSKAAREAKQRQEELEARAAGGEKAASVSKLVAAGKHKEAAEAMGIDINAAVAEILGQAPEAAA